MEIIETLDRMDVSNYPQMLMDVGLDPEMLMDVGLDPTKTMDFALFGYVCCRCLVPEGSHKSMARFLERTSCEYRPPNLGVILYDDLLQNHAWGWERLLPWESGYVLFEDYFGYLERYFLRQIRPVSGLHAAAAECVEAEDALSSIAAAGHDVLAAGHHELSKKIKDEALRHLVVTTTCPDPSGTVVTVPAACLMCIAEEARLLSEVLRRWIAEVADGERWATEELHRDFKFGNKVRKVVLDILTTYRGPYSKQISAAMVGMKKEAIIGRELLHLYDAIHEEMRYISGEIREFTLELLKIIRDRFPRESSIDYRPIEPDRAILRKMEHTEQQLSEPREP
jgi:hypothetical protein